jgi:hypothetical protein
MNVLILALSMSFVFQAPAPVVRPPAANAALKADFQANMRQAVEKKRAKQARRRAADRARAAVEAQAYRDRLNFEQRMAPVRIQEAALQQMAYRNEIAAMNAATNARIAQTYSYYGAVTYDPSVNAIVPYGMSPLQR